MLHFHVPDMTCGGCARSVIKALQRIDPDVRVETDPSSREVRVQTAADEDTLRAALADAGFPAS